MRIDSAMPNSNLDIYQSAARKASALAQPQNANYSGQGVIVEISQEAKDYNNLNKLKGPNGIQKVSEIGEVEECQTCKNRKYVDESNDPSVSYQSPQHISPGQSGAKVAAHEREHVTNERAKAEREDRRIVSQTVSLSTSVCPECGKVYVSGGVTRTVTAGEKKTEAAAEDNGKENT